MSEQEDKSSFSYTKVIDLTRRAQREQHSEQQIQDIHEGSAEDLCVRLDELSEIMRAALGAAGWDSLMPVQEQVIPHILEGADLIVQSRTGSGKTGAFLLPLFERLDSSRRVTQALVMAPTRELAKQINEVFEHMKRATPETRALDSVLVYGGVDYRPQVRGLQDGAQVVIGTPGRILDHLSRGNADFRNLDYVIFDEADEMLSMGFYPDMQALRRYLPAERCTLMFSATIPPRVRSLSRDFLTEPRFISLSAGKESIETMEYRYYVTDPMEKDRVLVRLFEIENPESAIVFVNRKKDVEYLTTFLRNYGYSADAISGDLSQKAREAALARTHSGETRFLVATDVAARGIDISDLSHVFMYDVPQDPEYLIHRSGRTARAGKIGVAVVLATVEDETDLIRSAMRYGVPVAKCPVPSPEEVSARVAERLTVVLEKRFRKRTDAAREHARQFVPLVEELAREEPEILAMLVSDIAGNREQAPQAKAPQPERLAAALEKRFRNGTNMERERAGQFVPLVRELAREEPEILAMLARDIGGSSVQAPPQATQEKRQGADKKRGRAPRRDRKR